MTKPPRGMAGEIMKLVSITSPEFAGASPVSGRAPVKKGH